MSLSEVLASHRVVICVGSGGVGKTTTAAALAVHAASEGKRVLCLTIDPAHRLANSLGLSEMKTEEQIISSEVFERQGLTCRGQLSAMMLDTKRTFDDLVSRHASSPQSRDRILNNQLYRYVSTSLAATQDYMAMEKLHSVRKDPSWDLIVLDTPPTTNALDFLDAPERLIGALDSPAMRWFVQAFEGAGRLSLGMVGRGAAFLIRGLARFTGIGFLEQVAEFVTGMNELFGGFRDRATEVADALRSSEVAFVVVTNPQNMAVREAIYFANRLKSAGMPRDAFVVNGVHPLLEQPEATMADLARDAAEYLPEGTDPEDAVHRLKRSLDDERVIAQSDRAETARLKHHCDPDTEYVQVPAFDEDVHDIAGLARVASYLTGAQHLDDAA